ncbi:MAG TPA: zf-TFIIB domain-containing protein [Kofleriaceae bacterium]|jgi:Zn-finger nucleic acid-binding protein
MESCPRCGTELTQAGAARACSTCSGLWLGVGDLDEMATQMQNPPQQVNLKLLVVDRQPLACPSCSTPMQTVELFGVPIDICRKKHGVWFDANELAQVLLRSVGVTSPDMR